VTPTGPVRIDPSTLPPEELLVATGIVFEEGGFHAYIEHLLQQGLVQLKVGDTIREGNREVGEVTEIRMDVFTYRKSGGTEEVSVGVSYNLKGTRVDSIQGERLRLQTLTGGGGGGSGFGERQFGGGIRPSGDTPAITGGRGGFTGGGLGFGNRGNTSTPAIAPPPLDPSSAGLTMEERLKLRRAQEAAGTLPQVPVAAEAPPAEEPAAPAAAAADEPAPAAPGVDVNSLTNLTPEERMMLRRRQELGE
jgi:hypothetical protein